MSNINRIMLGNLFDEINPKIQIEQNREEIVWALDRCREHTNPKYICEIGAGEGGNLCMLASLLHDDGILISIDPFANNKIFQHDDVVNMISPIRLHCIEEFSWDPPAINTTRDILGDNKLDILFIDGDHEYESTKSDWDNYIGFMGNLSCVVFHDLIGGTQGPTRFFPELLDRGYKGEVLCLDPIRYGIGIIYL